MDYVLDFTLLIQSCLKIENVNALLSQGKPEENVSR